MNYDSSKNQALGNKRCRDELASEQESAPSSSNFGTCKRDKSSADGFHGVTHHVRTNRYEAHIWQNGKQVYLGGYETAELAALAFDIAVVRFRGRSAQTNYNIAYYEAVLEDLDKHSPEEVIAGLRKHSKGTAMQTSVFRGVTRHQKGRWEARIGQATGRRYQYLGLHDTEVQAAMTYDRAAIAQKGIEAVTNFHLSEYLDVLTEEQIAEALQQSILVPEDFMKDSDPQSEPDTAESPSSSPAAQLADCLFECIMGDDMSSPQTVLRQPRNHHNEKIKKGLDPNVELYDFLNQGIGII